MTALAACLFVFAALASGWVIVVSWLRFGASMKALRAQIADCPDDNSLRWQIVEPEPSLSLNAGKSRPSWVTQLATGLEWPQSRATPLPLAA